MQKVTNFQNVLDVQNQKLCSKFILRVLVCVLAALLCISVLAFAGCNINSEGIAAKVGDTNIMEDEITEYIQNMRETNGLTSDAQWKAYLEANNVNTTDLRNTIINDKVDQEVVRQLAAKYGFSATQAEIDDQIAQMKSSFSSEEEFSATMEQYGMTLEQLTESCEVSILQDKVSKKLLETAEVSEDTINNFYMNYSSTMNGAKGYYQIIFNTADGAKAAEYDTKIKSGAITFEDACKEVTAADTQGLNFDYVSYSNFIQNPDEVNNAMKNMHVGDYSGVINASDYIYLIKVVDEVNCEDTWSINNLPAQTQENIKTYVKNVSASDVYNQELDKARDEIGVVIYDKPVGLPYSNGLFG